MSLRMFLERHSRKSRTMAWKEPSQGTPPPPGAPAGKAAGWARKAMRWLYSAVCIPGMHRHRSHLPRKAVPSPKTAHAQKAGSVAT